MLESGISKSIRIVLILITVLLVSIPPQAQYSGGYGEPNDPYQIATANDWVELMNTSADWDKNFIMTSDIDVNGVFLTPVGNDANKFTGIFDGNECIIYNADVNIPDSNNIGLFGYVGTDGQIKSIGTEYHKIIGDDYVGGLVGINYGDVNNCFSTSTIDGNAGVGGLVGANNGTVTNCYSTCMVSGVTDIGGLVGSNVDGGITASYSSGYITGLAQVGGLVGGNYGGNITISYSTTTVTVDSRYVSFFSILPGVGGLVGINTGSIESCYSAGSTTGLFSSNSTLFGYAGVGVGGLVGNNKESGVISNCFSIGEVFGGSAAVGGLIGLNDGSILKCYSKGHLDFKFLGIFGGLIGFNYLGDINDCFWDMETSNIPVGIGNLDPDPNDVFGKLSAEMYTRTTFTNAGRDFIGETINGPNDIWWILDQRDYPRLWWQLPTDDFNDCNAPPLWFVYETEPESVWLQEINGWLEINTTGAMENVDAIYVSDGWQLDANETFAIQVDFHFSKTGFGDGRLTLGIAPSLEQPVAQWAQLEAGTFDDYPFYLYEVRAGDWVEEQVCERFLDDGILYMSYDPNSDELYFSDSDYGKDDAIWTVTGLIRDKWQAESIYITLGGGAEDGMILTGEDAWLDNFAVKEGVIRQ